MQLFDCQHCGQTLHFENGTCESCGHRLGFVPAEQVLAALSADGDRWRRLDDPSVTYRFCINAEHDACNWLVEEDDPSTYCRSCRHNRVVPDLSVAANLQGWRRLEVAKHRLFYSLLKFGLPLATRTDRPDGLGFDMLADPVDPAAPKVLTGHDTGLITINIAEADDVERESRRIGMGEPYRTLLGHFRHEVGHYYWDRLVGDGSPETLSACRAIFGDERTDYAEALRRHYSQGASPESRARCVSAYATSHPWEDFAETWAHYLHIVDTLDTASSFGLRLQPRAAQANNLATRIDFDAYRAETMEILIHAWIPMTIALNSLNRSMGLRDLYPFVLAPAVVEKLRFIHRLIGEASAVTPQTGQSGDSPAERAFA